ncbi:dihydrofolate reductase [Epilithonimonas arachidiradicis]|uniref:Dihydrofolate reductase n=1 Tax=Epilithonimonas arachidiradicis TaxID=1617282 RepID=A0A420DBE2_9FLAO|nr:dihydrofolate reductase [Epilithonimonas arachidiradicis]RKE88791.1 dihydrofolate reductase [Epilithonimonas arachidiradicis]GGG55032.1 dihydrofolate reductase [Epilithonimonas arachidiradicis]
MITIIAAIGNNNALGKDNQLLWRLPKDLKHFKTLTENHPVVMGRKTYESIGKALPNRTNIVVSRKPDWFSEDILIVSTLKEALKFAKKINENFFVIGGGEIYKQTMDVADKLEITHVKADFEADTFFPKIDPKIWQKTDEECHSKDDKNDYDFCFQTFEKINKN